MSVSTARSKPQSRSSPVGATVVGEDAALGLASQAFHDLVAAGVQDFAGNKFVTVMKPSATGVRRLVKLKSRDFSAVRGLQKMVVVNPAISRDIQFLKQQMAALLAQTGGSPAPGPVQSPVAQATQTSAQQLVDESPIRPLDPLKAKLQQRAVMAVLEGTEWLTATEVGTRADPKAKNKYALATRLVKDGRVFAIEHGGHKRYPAYAFDPLGSPIPALREVLATLSDCSPFGLASWFESTSSSLGGRRPRELLGTQPQAVIAAAQAHSQGPVHG